ncbi:MAG: trigger factor [Sphaerochaeta sp.]|uniref:trigger factor n=1 Tax=Sphaerochaeta sp. TaxID=1972642 RepID=UPI001E15216C|nr:trigger factor [uncultured Sphaerochaeta sp.]MDD3057634.1 trigger factor [Sphaerochaeta sp.]MDD3928563.1 trigger factor [Sphaerochaeta sp.]NCC89861.1 trigger factor [Spirochaetia bacterium]
MIADKSIKELENSSVALTVTVTADTIENDYKAALQKYASTIQLKGFRKGKAPISVLEGKFGKAIREESTFNTIEEALKEVLEGVEEKYKPLSFSTPELQDEETLLPFKANSDVTFTVKYDVMPTFEMPAYKGLSVSYPKVQVSDEAVNAEVDKLREQNAMVIDKNDAAAMGDIVTVSYVELDAENNEVPGTERKEFVFTLGSTYNFYQIDSDIVGMKSGEEKTFSKTYAEDSTVEGYAGKTITLKVNVESVKFRDVPVLDDEFAQDVKEEYKTVADLLKATREKLEKALEAKLEQAKLNALSDELLKGTTIAVPASMIDLEIEQSWNRYVKQTGLTEEQILQFLQFQQKTKEDVVAPWREAAEKSLRIQLIMEKIKETEKFPLDEEELNKVLAEQLKDITDESQRDYYKTMIEDDMRFQKIAPFLQENNTFTEGEEVAYDVFMSETYGA